MMRQKAKQLGGKYDEDPILKLRDEYRNVTGGDIPEGVRLSVIGITMTGNAGRKILKNMESLETSSLLMTWTE